MTAEHVARSHLAVYLLSVTLHRRLASLSLAALVSSCGAARELPRASNRDQVVIARNGSQPSAKGPAANFTGSVTVTPLFAATEHTRAAGASVAFEPGAHSAWHSHPAGQTLIVTAGTGWVQQWGGVKQQMNPGDVIWTPPGVKHWHGATPTSAMTHIAIQEHVDNKVVDWMEHVSDEQYAPSASPAVEAVP